MIYELARFDPPHDGRHVHPLLLYGQMEATDPPQYHDRLVVTGDPTYGVTLTRDDVLDLIDALTVWLDDTEVAR